MRIVLAAAAAAQLAGCGDDRSCGVGETPVGGLELNNGNVVLATYDLFSAVADDGCPAADAPEGVVSLTISGVQLGTANVITLCVPRPDHLGDEPGALGVDVTFAVHAESPGCEWSQSASGPMGTITASGVCANGVDPAGFALALGGRFEGVRNCGGDFELFEGHLTGTVAVTAAAE